LVELIDDFVSRFATGITIDRTLLVENSGRVFLLTKNLKKYASKGFYYAGAYLGRIKSGRFFPSFNLLNMITEKKGNSIIVDKKSAWLFVCGRDVFKKGIARVSGSPRKGDFVLVLNTYDECLGFGRLVNDLEDKRENVVAENLLDIGDFLRRERRSRD
jgi:ribosome biogenesis protein Nip4